VDYPACGRGLAPCTSLRGLAGMDFCLTRRHFRETCISVVALRRWENGG
jgi:hypothetical protein